MSWPSGFPGGPFILQGIHRYGLYNVAIMKVDQKIPGFDDQFPDLNQFILELVGMYHAGRISSWDDLGKLVNAYFTPARMGQMESALPGWRKMSSFMDGITLVHVMCVFLGLCMLPEFLCMTKDQQQLMKWIVLFHDIEKEPQQGKRDHTHAFRSAVRAARAMPALGFTATADYGSLIDRWDELTCSARLKPEDSSGYIQDNGKLPEILEGIAQMFGHNTPAALIVKTILFHLSIDMEPWPPATPLTEEEITRYMDSDLLILLEAMHLGDSEGWSMFHPEREELKHGVRKAFREVERLIVD